MRTLIVVAFLLAPAAAHAQALTTTSGKPLKLNFSNNLDPFELRLLCLNLFRFRLVLVLDDLL